MQQRFFFNGVLINLVESCVAEFLVEKAVIGYPTTKACMVKEIVFFFHKININSAINWYTLHLHKHIELDTKLFLIQYLL